MTCKWCGKSFLEHDERRQPGEPDPRVPCLMLRSGFVAADKTRQIGPLPDPYPGIWAKALFYEVREITTRWLEGNLLRRDPPPTRRDWEDAIETACHRAMSEQQKHIDRLTAQIIDMSNLMMPPRNLSSPLGTHAEPQNPASTRKPDNPE
jgi:hypothetical protein